MKKNSLLFFFFVGFGSSIFGQNAQKIASQIKTVHVYLNQAQVERTANLDLEIGIHSLIFDKISPVLTEGSIEVKAPEGIEILSVSTQKDFDANNQIKPNAVLVLEDSLAVILEHLQEVKADKEAISWQRELLISNKSIGGSNLGVKTEELEDMLAIYERKFEEFKTKQIIFDRKEKQLILQRDAVQNQLNEFNNGLKTLFNQIVLQVRVLKKLPNAHIDFTYIVSEVSWNPFYDIRVKDNRGPVQFTLKANLVQTTGENWENVALHFTTSNPPEGGLKPELQPLFLNFKTIMGYVGTYNGDAPAPMAAKEAVEDKFIPLQATPTQSFLNLSFSLHGMSNIPSDGKIHVMELTSFSQGASYGLSVVPKLNPNVFVTAKIQTNDLINQLNGEANVYLNGVYTGKTFLGQQAEDSLLLTLGRDYRLLVKREKVKSLCSKSFFGSTKKEAITIEISITNSSTEMMEIGIEDQIPLSANSEIAVKLAEGNGGILNAESGKLTWKVSVGSKQKVTKRFSFEVSSPAEKPLTDY